MIDYPIIFDMSTENGAPADSTPVALRDSGRAYKAIWRLGAATDVLVWTHYDFEERLQLKASLPSTIAREGRLLYAA
jgi:hypothetical protein